MNERRTPTRKIPTQNIPTHEKFSQEDIPYNSNNYGMNEEYIQSKEKKSKKNVFFVTTIVLTVLLIVFGGLFIKTTFFSSQSIDLVENPLSSSPTQNELQNQLSENMITSTKVDFNGEPVAIKWPVEVTPTRMDLKLDPITGEPVLMLVGEKQGLGTVIRSYNSTGSLTGFWVIVPEGQVQTQNNTETQSFQQQTEQQTNQQTNQQTETNTQGQGN